MKRAYIIFCSLILVMFTSCKSGKTVQKEETVYSTMEVSRSSQTLLTKYAATLEGRQMVEIRPQVSGTITKISFNEGDKVRKGQTLFILDQVPYKAALDVALANEESAKAQVETAKLTAESNQMLYDKNVISTYDLQTSKNTLESAKATYSQAQAQVTSARNDLSYTIVRSPLDGVAGMINYRVGALVGSSITTPLVSVSDDSSIYAYFSLSENQILDLMSKYGGQAEFMAKMPDVKLIMSNGQEYPQTGRIDAVSGIVDSGTGAVRVRAAFDNSSRLLRSGGSASIEIPTIVEDAIVIPQTATYEIQEKVFVYKVVDGKASSTEVKVFHLNNGTEYVVESGLEEGDVIVAEGAGLLKEGTEIKTAK